MKDELMSIITEYGELTLDFFLPDGVIKRLPIIGSAFSMIKISTDIRDRSFIENVEENKK